MTRTRLPAIGFWSYARRDDELADDHLTRLRELIKREIQLQFGRGDIILFQDTAAIPHGADWERETFDALGRSTFFIPIVTPNFIQSEWCARETLFFLARERRLLARHPDLGPRSLIFPIDYRKIRVSDACKPETLSALKARQWCAFQDLRHEELGAKAVKKRVAEFAETICDLLAIEVAAPLTPEEAARREAEADRRRAEAAMRGAEAKARKNARANADASKPVPGRMELQRERDARAKAAAKAEAFRRWQPAGSNGEATGTIVAVLGLLVIAAMLLVGFTGTAIIVSLMLMMIASLPTWGHSRNWGYGPSGLLGTILVVVVILVLLKYI